MPEAKMIVLYPQPTDIARFDRDYREHLRLLHRKMGIPEGVRPYAVTRFLDTPMGKPGFCQMFSMAFSSPEALAEAMKSLQMQELAADAARISSGGQPVMLVGVD